jgi:hypothetical protein
MERSETRHRVLIVDDEEPMRLLLARFIREDLKAEISLAGTERAQTLGADAFVPKPVNRQGLLAVVVGQLNNGIRRQEIRGLRTSPAP